MTATYIQAALYPTEKLSLSKKANKKFLSQLREYLGAGNIILGETWNRLITPNAEILYSFIGCVEVYGEANELIKLLPRVISLARDNGHPFHWIFLDPEKPSIKTKEAITNIRGNLITRKECRNITIGGER